jgi:hypothetical protein
MEATAGERPPLRIGVVVEEGTTADLGQRHARCIACPAVLSSELVDLDTTDR